MRLSNFFNGKRPVLLVPGYYRCPQLCELVMHGLLDSLQQSDVPRARWRIVGISINPAETPRNARARRDIDTGYAETIDPRAGRYTNTLMNSVCAVCLLLAAGLAFWIWRRRHASGGAR